MKNLQENFNFVFISAVVSGFVAVIVSEMLYMVHNGNKFVSWLFVISAFLAIVYIYRITKIVSKGSRKDVHTKK